MPTEKDFADAAETLSDPVAPEAVKAAARRVLQAYKPPTETTSDFGEHSSIGPTGLDIGAPAEVQLDEQARTFRGQERALDEHPDVVKALKSQGIMAGAPMASAQDKADAIVAKADDRAKVREQLQRPTVLTAPGDLPTAQNETKGVLDVFSNIGPRLQNAKRLLPSAMGGNVEHFVEPSLDEFRKTMAPLLGEKAYGLTNDSEEYRDFADAAWAEVYDKAKQEGRSVTRHDKSDNKDPGWQAAELIRQAGGASGTMLNAATGGLGTKYAGRRIAAWGGHPEQGEEEAQNLERVSASSHPALNAGAEVYGAIESPLFKGAAKLIPGTTVARTAAQAGLGSAGYKAAELGARRAGGEDLGLGQAAEEVGESAGMGIVAGGLLGLGGKAIRSERAGLRANTPLGEAEKAGASMRVTGVEPGENIRALREEARAGGHGYADKPDVNKMLAGRLEEPLGFEAGRSQSEAQRLAGEAKAEFHSVHGNDTVQPSNAQKALESVHESITRREGDVIGGHESLAREISRRLGSMSTIEVVPAGTATGGIPASDAMKKGYDVLPEIAKAVGSSVAELKSVPSMLDDVDVLIHLKDFNPAEHDALVKGFDKLAEVDGKPGLPSGELKSLLEASRADRDRFTGGSSGIPSTLTHTIRDAEGNPKVLHGYSAKKAIEAEKLETLKKRNELAKPSNVPRYGEPGGDPGRDQALRDVAEGADAHGFPGTSDVLEQFKGNRAVERLEDMSKLRGGARIHGLKTSPVEHLSSTAIRLRLDPLLGAIEPQLGRAAGVGASQADKRLRQKPNVAGADQDTIDKIQRLLGVAPP